tara:strand:+ start:18757 stop:19122 length:366 start_codon:yes stop_codon:yes gene_type:complete
MILDIIIKSRNVIDKLHWAAKGRLRDEYILLIKSEMVRKKIPKADKDRCYTLEIVSWRKRLLDYDNLVGGCKQLIDAMVHAGFIYDDSNKHIRLMIKQVKNTDPLRKKHKRLHNKTWVLRY